MTLFGPKTDHCAYTSNTCNVIYAHNQKALFEPDKMSKRNIVGETTLAIPILTACHRDLLQTSRLVWMVSDSKNNTQKRQLGKYHEMDFFDFCLYTFV